MPMLQRVAGVQCSNPPMRAAPAQAPVLPAHITAIQASAGHNVRRVMASAGIEGLGDVDRFSEQQLHRMLEGKTPSERIGIKNLLLASGLYPRPLS